MIIVDRTPTRRQYQALELAWRAGRVPDGARVTFANPTKAAKGARRAYNEFHWGRSSRRTRRVNLPDLSEIYSLGKLRAVEYETTKGKSRAIWVHEFSRPYPELTATPTGKLGPIVGGKARVTRRGIED